MNSALFCTLLAPARAGTQAIAPADPPAPARAVQIQEVP
jgi:hypothetical protein